MMDMLQAILSFYGVCTAVLIGGGWITYRVREHGAKETEGMSEAACAMRVEELLRRGR